MTPWDESDHDDADDGFAAAFQFRSWKTAKFVLIAVPLSQALSRQSWIGNCHEPSVQCRGPTI